MNEALKRAVVRYANWVIPFLFVPGALLFLYSYGKGSIANGVLYFRGSWAMHPEWRSNMIVGAIFFTAVPGIVLSILWLSLKSWLDPDDSIARGVIDEAVETVKADLPLSGEMEKSARATFWGNIQK